MESLTGENKLTEPKILFAGTPAVAVPLLKALLESFDIAGVLTSCDKSSRRSGKLLPSPVKAAASELGIPVLQFDSLRTPAREAVKALGADTLVTFAFGKIFGPMFLELFPNGRFNVHPSNLPLLRGPSPIQFTILNGLKEACVSFQNVGLKMDEGDVWGKSYIELDGTETTQSLTDRVGEEASLFIPGLLKKIFDGKIQAKTQEGEPSYCALLEKSSGKLDFNQTAAELHAKVRAFYPWPKTNAVVTGPDMKESDIAVTGVWGGFRELEQGESSEGFEPGDVAGFCKEKGLGVACRDKILWISSLQIPAKKELDSRAFINGNRWILKSKFK